MSRFDQLQTGDQFQQTRLDCKIDHYNAGKKNQGGAAFNLIDLKYEENNRGTNLKRVDDDANVRATLRAKNLQYKGNGSFNILTGQDTQMV